jgi:hypothetical protein
MYELCVGLQTIGVISIVIGLFKTSKTSFPVSSIGGIIAGGFGIAANLLSNSPYAYTGVLINSFTLTISCATLVYKIFI